MSDLTPQFVEQYAVAPKSDKPRLCRELTGSQKMELGVLLFDREREIIKAEIFRQMPQASDMFVCDVLRMAVRMIHGVD